MLIGCGVSSERTYRDIENSEVTKITSARMDEKAKSGEVGDIRLLEWVR